MRVFPLPSDNLLQLSVMCVFQYVKERVCLKDVAKVRHFFESTKFFLSFF